MLILLDFPYVSAFLLDTLERLQIPVVWTGSAAVLTCGRNINAVPPEEAITRLSAGERPILYSNSENAIGWIVKNLPETDLPDAITRFKNKVRFREMMQDIYPGYYFKGIETDHIHTLDISRFPLPFIIKPAVGFFSLGVNKVEAAEEWPAVSESLLREIGEIRHLYPDEVLNTNGYIIEECIEGDEFAIDCYFDSHGDPVILNIMKHLFASGKDVNDRVYITSAEIIRAYLASFTDFLRETGKRAGIRNFPAHIEVRVNADGKVAPIEVNPLRFGGWCSTPDLAHYAFGLNLYETLFLGQKPDWDALLSGKEGLIYSNIVLNNSTGLPGREIELFDYERLMSDFEHPLELRKADFRKFPIFGFLFCETRAENMDELYRILHSDLKEYVTAG
jgi:hypothetical protein